MYAFPLEANDTFIHRDICVGNEELCRSGLDNIGSFVDLAERMRDAVFNAIRIVKPQPSF
jgi:hypothetical protein